jgi:hypothetical protein
VQDALIIAATIAMVVGAFCLGVVSRYVILLTREREKEAELAINREGAVGPVPVFDVAYGEYDER